MAETTAQQKSSRNTKIGRVVSTKMAKTIVVQVIMKRAHPLYRRVVAKSKKFYAHDETNTAHVGDTVEIEETCVPCPSFEALETGRTLFRRPSWWATKQLNLIPSSWPLALSHGTTGIR